MKKILRQVTGTTVGFTFTKEEREIYELDEVGSVYDIEVVKVRKNEM